MIDDHHFFREAVIKVISGIITIAVFAVLIYFVLGAAQ